jgi:hypothetical protein
MRCGLFVTDKDVLDLVLVEDGVVDVKGCPAGVAEYEFNTFIVQGTNECITTG